MLLRSELVDCVCSNTERPNHAVSGNNCQFRRSCTNPCCLCACNRGEGEHVNQTTLSSRPCSIDDWRSEAHRPRWHLTQAGKVDGIHWQYGWLQTKLGLHHSEALVFHGLGTSALSGLKPGQIGPFSGKAHRPCCRERGTPKRYCWNSIFSYLRHGRSALAYSGGRPCRGCVIQSGSEMLRCRPSMAGAQKGFPPMYFTVCSRSMGIGCQEWTSLQSPLPAIACACIHSSRWVAVCGNQ